MENSKKIIFYIMVLTFILSCKTQKQEKSNTYITVDKKGNYIFKSEYLLGKNSKEKYYYTIKDSIYFNSVYINNVYQPINKIIDINSFNIIPSNDTEKEKIDNEYYLANPFNNYYKDKENLYIYSEDGYNKPIFFYAGKINMSELIGGAYIRTENKIYWRGYEVKTKNINSFRVIKVLRNESEWEASIGSDDNYLYNGDQIMNYKSFNKNFIWGGIEDSLRNIYFPNE